MKIRWLVVAFAVLLSVPVQALTVAQKVTPKWTKEQGITVETVKREDGTIGFTVTRYLDKVRVYPDDLNLKTECSAHLQMRNPAGVVLSTMVAGDEKNGTETFWFALSPNAINVTQFSLSEHPVSKDATQERLLIGGGTIYEFDLNEFAAPLLKPKAPEHP